MKATRYWAVSLQVKEVDKITVTDVQHVYAREGGAVRAARWWTLKGYGTALVLRLSVRGAFTPQHAKDVLGQECLTILGPKVVKRSYRYKVVGDDFIIVAERLMCDGVR